MPDERENRDDDELISAAPRLPHDLEAEQFVLGGVLLTTEKFSEIDGKLDPEDFYNPAYGKIFKTLITLHNANKPLDLLLLRDELQRQGDLETVGGAVTLAALASAVPTGSHVDYYADLVREKSLQRRLIAAATKIVETATNPGQAVVSDIIDAAENAIFQVAEKSIGTEPQALRKIMPETMRRLESMANHGAEAADTVRTGFIELDEMLTGMHGGELLIVAARPSMGKSTFALNIARKAALDHKQKVLIFSLEMTAHNLAMNILAAHSRIDAQKLRNPVALNSDQWKQLTFDVGALAEANIVIDDASLASIVDIRGKARREQKRNGVNLIIIDYLQIMKGSSHSSQRSREQEVAEISRGLKALAKELKVPVVALSQLNRNPDGRTDKRPQMSDLRESGAIEQDADVIMLLHRPDYYAAEVSPGEAEVIVAKQRNGPTGTVNLSFIRNELRFETLSHIHHNE